MLLLSSGPIWTSRLFTFQLHPHVMITTSRVKNVIDFCPKKESMSSKLTITWPRRKLKKTATSLTLEFLVQSTLVPEHHCPFTDLDIDLTSVEEAMLRLASRPEGTLSKQ